MIYAREIERWGMLEIKCSGKTDGNPFVDYTIEAVFKSQHEEKRTAGFYDGDGVYIVRFMPSFIEEYQFTIEGSFSDQTYQGSFRVTPPGDKNHGPVRVANTYHFAYEDGTSYYPMGTTCYAWVWQSDELVEQTLDTLEKHCFNKIRFCLLPKHLAYNLKDPVLFPYEGKAMDASILTDDNFWEYLRNIDNSNEWNFEKFQPAYFKRLDDCIERLGELGIEADLIVMHPYDRWGFSRMSRKQDDLYWNYVAARYSAYRNIWWSLANEYDTLPDKTIEDWEHYADILCTKDPYNHLRSIHNWSAFYDYTRPWVTHCSIQKTDMYRTAENTDIWREQYKKPVVLDEISYEGDVPYAWGNISGQEMVRRFWEAACRGGYGGHGETYSHPADILWWSHGGVLHGTSPNRIGFLHNILLDSPPSGLMPVDGYEELVTASDLWRKYYLCYFGLMKPCCWRFEFPVDRYYEAEVIDTWEMTIEKRGVFSGRFILALPSKEYMAVRFKEVNESEKKYDL